MTEIGEYVNSTGIVLDDAVRGVQYRFEAAIYEDGAAPGTCSAEPVVGDPFNAAAWPSIQVQARIGGTGVAAFVVVGYSSLGAPGVPASWFFRIPTQTMEAAFPADQHGTGGDGTYGSIDIVVSITNTGGSESRTLFKGEVIICDSGAGVSV